MELGASSELVGGLKLDPKKLKRTGKVRLYLRPDEHLLLEKIQEELHYSTKTPVIRWLIYHYENIKIANELVWAARELSLKQRAFDKILGDMK